MDPKIHLFTHARPKVKLPPKCRKMRLSFLDLPGEVRNEIYKYYFQNTYRCELVGAGSDLIARTPKSLVLLPGTSLAKQKKQHKGKKSGDQPSSAPLTLRFPRLRSDISSHLHSGWLNPHGAVILVCKQVHTETLPLLYQQVTFVLESPHRINSFLRRTPQKSQSNVTRLHLYYTTYGSPASASDVTWQEKHVESWTRACKAAAKALTCLRELHIDIRITEGAPKFNLRQEWLQPMLQFRRLTRHARKETSPGNKPLVQRTTALYVVRVRVRSRLWAHDFAGNLHVARACKDLHRLYGLGISQAILGARKKEAMSAFKSAWEGKHKRWQHHLGFAKTGW